MNRGRVPTGVAGLDPLIQGGFPRGSLVAVAGNPGTGKTIFGAQFLYGGATSCGEKGIYVSFVEGADVFHQNMSGLGMDFYALERQGMFKLLDLTVMRGEEGVASILEHVLSEIYSMKAKRLVIDSFSAMSLAFKSKFDARAVLHTILSKMTRQAGCTTILIIEVPTGQPGIGMGLEEFVADGIIVLRKTRVRDRSAREIEVHKIRGTILTQPVCFFTLHEGFHVFPPFQQKIVGQKRRFEPVQDTATHFSTGSEDLDKMLGGGYPRGSVVLLEIGENVSAAQYQLVYTPTLVNFGLKGRGMPIVPTGEMDALSIAEENLRSYGVPREDIDNLLRVFDPVLQEETSCKPYVIPLSEGRNIFDWYGKYIKIVEELTKRTGQPVVNFVGVDTLEALFEAQQVKEYARLAVAKIRQLGNLIICLSKPGLEPVTQRIANVADVHLKLIREHGTLLLHGLKPRTGLHVLEIDVSKGYPLPKLTPLI